MGELVPAIKKVVGLERIDWLREAEKIGTVCLDTAFGGVREARIEVGRWGRTQIYVFGRASSTDEALRSAIQKAERIHDALEFARRDSSR